MGSVAGHHSIHSHATGDGKVSSSESESSNNEGDGTAKDGNTGEDKGGIETSSDGQVALDGEEGQECPHTQDTFSSISQVFSGHKDTDPESDPGEKIRSIQQKWHPKNPKEDSPLKESSELSSSEEKLPTDEALHNRVRQKAWLLDMHFEAWHHDKIVKGISGWVARDTMICDLPKHGKVQPNHPNPWGQPWTTWENAKSLTTSGPISMTCADPMPWGQLVTHQSSPHPRNQLPTVRSRTC